MGMTELPNWAWWIILLSPAWLTPLISYPFVSKANTRIGLGKAMAISSPAAAPLASLAAMVSFEGDVLDSMGLFLLLIFCWVSVGGPFVVEITQWLYLKGRRLMRDEK